MSLSKTYIDADRPKGVRGTKILAADMNTIFGEFNTVLSNSSITPDGTDGQLNAALKAFYAPINSPILTGTPQTTVPPAGDNSSRIPTTSWVLSTVTAGTQGVYVSQGGGTNMGANTIKLGTQSGDANNFLIQSDTNTPEYLVLGEDDPNTYGIRRFGYDHAAGITSALDSDGTWHVLAEQDWVNGNFLPLTGGTVTGQTTIEDIVFTNDSSLGNARIIHSDSDTYNHSISLMTDIYASSSGTSFVESSLTNVMSMNAWGGGFMFRDSSGAGDTGTRLMFVNNSSTTIYKPLTVEGTATITALNSDGGNFKSDGVGNVTILGDMTANNVRVGTGIPQGQGANMFWNAAGSGTTDFVNGRGLGSGGFTWLDGTTDMTENWSTITKDNYKIMTLDCSGNLQAKGNITAEGFVTSPNYIAAPSYHVDNNSNNSEIYFNNDTKSRWAIGKDNSGETGSNNGGNFVFARFNDDGSYLDIPLSILRASGIVEVNSGLTVPTVGTSDNSNNAASTAYVKNNLANYPANGTWATFNGVNFNNGASGATIYADTNKRDLLFHTTDGTTDHYMVLDEAGELTTPGNLVVDGAQWIGGELYTNTIGNNGSGTVTMSTNVNVTGTLEQGGSPVATETWVSENAVGTTATTSGSGDLRVADLVWSQAVGNKPYINHYQSDGSISDPVVLCTEANVYSGTIADNGDYSNIRYSVVNGVMDLFFDYSGSGNPINITFPKAFASGCVPNVFTNLIQSTMIPSWVSTYNRTNTTVDIYVTGNNAHGPWQYTDSVAMSVHASGTI